MRGPRGVGTFCLRFAAVASDNTAMLPDYPISSRHAVTAGSVTLAILVVLLVLMLTGHLSPFFLLDQ